MKRLAILDDLTDDVAFTAYSANDGCLARWAAPRLFLVPVSITVQSANVGFVYLDLAHQFWEIVVLHRGTDALAHIPSRSIITATNLAMNLKRADSFFGLAHQIDDLEPGGQRVIGVLKNRFGDDAKAITVAPATILVLTDPMERPRLERVDLFALAARTAHAVGPAHIAEQAFTGSFRRVFALQLGKRDVRLSGQRLSSNDFRVHEENIAMSEMSVKPNIIAKYFTLM
jgi:hypothetical protein